MVKKSKLRVTEVHVPELTFTPAVTHDDLSTLHHQPTQFHTTEVQAAIYTEEETQTEQSRRAESTLQPDLAKRWSYHYTLEIYRAGRCLDRGRCVDATWLDSNRLRIQWRDFSWDFDHLMLRRCVTLNIKGAEQAYWLVRLMHSGKNPNVLGYRPDSTMRPFRYAVPLSGLSNEDTGRLIGHTDFGITSSDHNDPTNKLIQQLTKDVDKDSWAADVPKVYGVVVARSPIEAEAHALRRARFAADLLTFALQTGASHFDTVHETQRLNWSARDSIATVSTRPWLLLVEAATLKGWVRSVPLTFVDKNARLKEAKERVRIFLQNFRRVAEFGDAGGQLQDKPPSARENRIAKAVQTAVHWLAEASRMSHDGYRLLPVWTALEAVLGAIEYPPVFDRRRAHLKNRLLATINGLEDSGATTEEVEELKDLLKARLLNNAWPVRTQLELFAKAFGIRLHGGDAEVVKRLSRVRNKAVHTGDTDQGDLGCEIRQLKYLVERLIMAASVCAVRATAGGGMHKVRIVGVEPGAAGAATIYIDGRQVPYVLSGRTGPSGSHTMTLISDGLIYDDSNSVIVQGGR